MKITINFNQENLKECSGWVCPNCNIPWVWFVTTCIHCGYKNDEYILKGGD